MARPWEILATAPTAEGPLELRRRGARDFMITLRGRVLMTSMLGRSEEALAAEGCAALAGRPAPRVLIGGLGLGITLRAALEALPAVSRVWVAELNPVVVAWCRGPARAAAGDALADARVQVVLADVMDVVRGAARPGAPKLDAILLDLYEGPRHAGRRGQEDPLYGTRTLAEVWEALVPGGVYGVWGEGPDRAFERRLRAQGFAVRRVHTPGASRRHAVFLASRPA
jgi:spermidine synthase